MKNTYLILMLLILLSSCKRDQPVEFSLDEQMLLVMQETAKDGLVSYYSLPNSENFSQIPQDPKNQLTVDKVKLGKFLFHETNLAINSKFSDGQHTFSCASCHHAAAGFQSGIPQGIGDGGFGFGLAGEGRIPNVIYDIDSLDTQPIRTPTAMNGAYQKVTLWNGQFGATGLNIGTEANWTENTPKADNNLGFEGLETQAIAGLKVHRMGINDDIKENEVYNDLFQKSFPSIKDKSQIDRKAAGLAIAAYERTVISNQAPFQKWIQGDYTAMSDQEKSGAILFFGKAKCVTCHSGPVLNSMEFHALGLLDLIGEGVYGTFSADMSHLGRGGFTNNSADNYKFKVPQLYNLKDSPFYGHGSSFTSIKELIEYKNNAIPENKSVPTSQISNDFISLDLTDQEIDDLTAFIENSLYDNNLDRYVPEMLPSGYCFPNGDIKSKTDLNCN